VCGLRRFIEKCREVCDAPLCIAGAPALYTDIGELGLFLNVISAPTSHLRSATGRTLDSYLSALQLAQFHANELTSTPMISSESPN